MWTLSTGQDRGKHCKLDPRTEVSELDPWAEVSEISNLAVYTYILAETKKK